jgi:hypothetical protein
MSQKTATILQWIITFSLPFALASFVIGAIIAPWLPSF